MAGISFVIPKVLNIAQIAEINQLIQVGHTAALSMG